MTTVRDCLTAESYKKEDALNSARSDIQSSGPRDEKDGRLFWVLTIFVTVLLAVIALVYLLTRATVIPKS